MQPGRPNRGAKLRVCAGENVWGFSQEPAPSQVLLDQFPVVGHRMSEAVVRLSSCQAHF